MLQALMKARDEEHKALMQQLSDVQHQLKESSTLMVSNDLNRSHDQDGAVASEGMPSPSMKAVASPSMPLVNSMQIPNTLALSRQVAEQPCHLENKLKLNCTRSRSSSPSQHTRCSRDPTVENADTGSKSPGRERAAPLSFSAADQVKSPARPPFRSPGRLKLSVLKRPESRGSSAIKKVEVVENIAGSLSQALRKEEVQKRRMQEKERDLQRGHKGIDNEGRPNDLSAASNIRSNVFAFHGRIHDFRCFGLGYVKN
jgi:hypothetical protein